MWSTKSQHGGCKELVDIHLRNYKGSGTDLVIGQGRFIAPKAIEVVLNDGGTRTCTR
jgi:hypothetical protein